jgi:hypothetical protein
MKSRTTTRSFIPFSYANNTAADDFCLDNGSPSHIIKDNHLFVEFQPFYHKFVTANGTLMEAHGIGKI